jgi:large subunit ribosomal protein L11
MAKGKKVTKYVKVEIEAGKAVPAPPLGPALGQAGIQIGDFVNKFNAATSGMKGTLPVKIYVYEDRTYDFILKTPPAAELIKKAIGISKGSGKPLKEKVGKITIKQIEEIAKVKMPDLNTQDLEAAKRSVCGTARSMGVEIIEK